jgi:glucoamylase
MDPPGKNRRIELDGPAMVHWSADLWKSSFDIKTRNINLALHAADLETDRLSVGTRFLFNFYYPETDQWENTDFNVIVE